MLFSYSAWFPVELTTSKTTISFHILFLTFFRNCWFVLGVDPGLSQDVAWYASQGGEPGREGYLALNLDSNRANDTIIFHLSLKSLISSTHSKTQALPTSPKLTHHVSMFFHDFSHLDGVESCALAPSRSPRWDLVLWPFGKTKGGATPNPGGES